MKIEQIIKSEHMPIARKTVIHLMVTAAQVTDIVVDVLKPFDLSLQQFNVLRILRGQKKKPANLSTIQDRMVAKMSNTTRLVDKLITKGYVERFICEANRRKVEIFITNQGLAILNEIDPLIDAAEEKVIENLTTEETSQINSLLEKLRTSNNL